MLRPKDAEKILTTHDLSGYVKEIVQKEDSDLKINIDYESGELFINCPGFSHGPMASPLAPIRLAYG